MTDRPPLDDPLAHAEGVVEAYESITATYAAAVRVGYEPSPEALSQVWSAIELVSTLQAWLTERTWVGVDLVRADALRERIARCSYQLGSLYQTARHHDRRN